MAKLATKPDTGLETLRSLREQTAQEKQIKLRVENVAAALGLGINTVRNWEKGKGEPSCTQAEVMAELYGCPISRLIQAVKNTKEA